MSSGHNYTIVVGIDFSGLSDSALDQALEMASLHAGAEVHVLYVEPDGFVGLALDPTLGIADADTVLVRVQERAKQRADRMAPHLRKRQIRRIVAHFRHGSPAENVAQLAADLDADLVVVGSHGHHGLERFFLGSVAERVSRLARCPVWIVRPKDYSTAGRVPEIEPACPDCLAKRAETGGVDLWCARHSEHHLRPHRYSYVSDGIFSAETTPYAFLPERGA
jgi:nucleotide-binding universal stress UspA family protein